MSLTHNNAYTNRKIALKCILKNIHETIDAFAKRGDFSAFKQLSLNNNIELQNNIIEKLNVYGYTSSFGKNDCINITFYDAKKSEKLKTYKSAYTNKKIALNRILSQILTRIFNDALIGQMTTVMNLDLNNNLDLQNRINEQLIIYGYTHYWENNDRITITFDNAKKNCEVLTSKSNFI